MDGETQLIKASINTDGSHAKRKTITPEDVFMVTRRNEDLTMLLKEHLVELNGNRPQQAQSTRVSRDDDDDDGDEDFEIDDDELIQATTANRRANR